MGLVDPRLQHIESGMNTSLVPILYRSVNLHSRVNLMHNGGFRKRRPITAGFSNDLGGMALTNFIREFLSKVSHRSAIVIRSLESLP